MTKLRYRDLLKIVGLIYGRGDFDARSVSSTLLKADQRIPGYLLDLRLLRQYSVKYISNDLNRIFKPPFGLLRRDRVKRKVRTRTGKACFRGYKYTYRLSDWGRKYLTYLVTGGAEKKEAEDFSDLKTRAMIEKIAPAEKKEFAKAIFLPGWRKPGASERFRNRKNEKIIQAYADYRKDVLMKDENLKKHVGKISDALTKVSSDARIDGDNVILPFSSFTAGIGEALSHLRNLVV